MMMKGLMTCLRMSSQALWVHHWPSPSARCVKRGAWMCLRAGRCPSSAHQWQWPLLLRAGAPSSGYLAGEVLAAAVTNEGALD